MNEDQLHQIRDARTEQILDAAVKVFARRGFTGTKMSMIAAEAGISHGLLYHYFTSKDELFNTLVQFALEEAVKAVGGVYAFQGSPIEQMRALTALILEPDNTPFFMLIHQAHTSDDVPEKTKELVGQYSMRVFIDQLLPLFVEGQRMGEIVAGDPEHLIIWYFTVVSSLMVGNTPDSPDYQPPDVDLLLRMIRG